MNIKVLASNPRDWLHALVEFVEADTQAAVADVISARRRRRPRSDVSDSRSTFAINRVTRAPT